VFFRRTEATLCGKGAAPRRRRIQSAVPLTFDVRYWPKRTCAIAPHQSAFGLKRNQTSQMSANDPKRTFTRTRQCHQEGYICLKKYRKFKHLKIFATSQPGPLEKKCSFSISLAAGCQVGPVRAPAVPGALLISMLLNGGCGYEDDEPRPLLADKHWL
jgi:hypothetical protein